MRGLEGNSRPRSGGGCSRVDLDRGAQQEGGPIPLRADPDAIPERDPILGIER